MDIDLTFLPVADLLINQTFPTPIVYHEHRGPAYDVSTGVVTPDDTDHNINAGILSRKRVENGGTNETYELLLWVEHRTLPIHPKTGDEITYDGTTWKVTAVEPTYSSKQLIASRLRVRSN